MSYISSEIRGTMIVHLSGKLIFKDPSYAIVDVQGVGYKVFISLNTFNALPNINKNVYISTYYNVTEKSHDLFGFNDNSEKDLFTMLISVSGIGPKIAINLLSFVKPDDFKQRLISGEVEMLTSLPGIGPKTARRIIVELKDKFIKIDKNDLPIDHKSNLDTDALNALMNLGFRSKDITKVLNEIDKNCSLEEKIKLALKDLR